MTDNEDTDIQTVNERAINQQLQFETNEWDGRAPGRNCHGCLTINWESASSHCVCFIRHLSIHINTNFGYSQTYCQITIH